MNKRLYKSDDPVFAGVCGGIGEYFDLDPTLVRILFIIICFLGLGLPVVIYLLVMIVMPKRPQNYASYIDVKPTVISPSSNSYQGVGAGDPAGEPRVGSTTGSIDAAADGANTGDYASGSATGSAGSSAGGKTGRSCMSNCSYAPGSAYTTANPQAYDAISSPDSKTRARGMGSGMQFGIVTGLILISLGIFGLLNIFLGISLWRFWPMILLLIGVFTLLTPGPKGWSLERAGNGIFTITLAFVLQLWVLNFFGLGVFVKTFLTLWPAILVAIGLGIIAAVSKKAVFSLFGSLLISGALVFGVWFFGGLPGYSTKINLPLLDDRQLSFTIPASPDLSDPNHLDGEFER